MDPKEAKRLLDKYLEGNCTHEEQLRVEAWLDKMNNRNPEWPQLTQESKKDFINNLFLDLQKKTTQKDREKRKTATFKTLYWSAAAVLVLAMAIGYLYPKINPGDGLTYLSASTGIGETEEIVLEDGSKIWLNSLSELRYPAHFGTNKREVYLSGEAFFNVSRNAGKPFIVHSGVVNTRVLGTQFNISAYSDNNHLEVTVLSGRVAVNSEGEKKSVVLAKHEKARYDKSNKQLTRTQAQHIGKAMAWQQGQLDFYHTPLKEVAKVLYRTFGLTLQFKNGSVAQCEISGNFDIAQPANEVLQAICLSIGGKFNRKGKTVTIQAPGCK